MASRRSSTTLEAGTGVGEQALLTDQRRTATVRALEPSRLMRLTRYGFERIARRDPEALHQFTRAMYPRLLRMQLSRVLTGLFGELDPMLLHSLHDALDPVRLKAGETLFGQGDPGDALYIILNGRLELLVAAADASTSVVGEVGSGETVGEWALVTREPRSTSAVAQRDSEIMRLSREAFERLLVHTPAAIAHLARMLLRRQHAMVGRSQRPQRLTYAVVPLSPSVPLGEFAQQLATALGSWDAALHVSSAACDRALDTPGIAQTEQDHPSSVTLMSWLHEQEALYPYVVYRADPIWSAWTVRCIAHADRILLVGHADSNPGLSDIERRLREAGVRTRTELVLIHPSSRKQPRGTRFWLAERVVAAHHHVRLEQQDDMGRLARRITGRAVGLVLGGGGTRGFAHIGVMRALEERGIAVDYIGGTSIGAVLGGCFAVGSSSDDTAAAGKRFGTPQALLDRTFPSVAFFRSRKLSSALEALYGDVRIEDLWHPYFCVASNLSRARTVVHQRGLLWRAVRASVAVPGVFSPVLYNGDVLVDGGVLDNLPVATMRELMPGGTLIAVDVGVQNESTERYDFGTSVSGWDVLRRKLNPFKRSMRVPSAVATLIQASGMNATAQRVVNQALADLMIVPEVGRFPIANFNAADAIAAAGYDEAQRALEAWGERKTVL